LESIWNKYRAYALWPKIHFLHQGKRVIIESLTIDEQLCSTASTQPLANTSHDLHPDLQQCMVKPAGKKTMTWDDFVRGYL
jgi:methionyl-tRNA formyltransferase